MPGTPTESALSRDFSGSGFPCASRNIACACRRRRGLAIIDSEIAIIFGEMDHHEAATADIAGAWIGDCEREADCDGGIDRIAAAIENFNADAGRALFLGDHQAVMREDRLRRDDRRRARRPARPARTRVA